MTVLTEQFDAKSFVDRLPARPGVYRMWGV